MQATISQLAIEDQSSLQQSGGHGTPATSSRLPAQAGSPRRLVQLTAGLALYGVSMGLMFRSALGLDPWDVFHAGVAEHVPLTFGQVVIVTGVVVLLLWIPLEQWPGLGTVANAVLIGIATDATLAVLTTPDDLTARARAAGRRHRAQRSRRRALHRRPARPRAARRPDDRPGSAYRAVGAAGADALEVSVLAVGFALGGTVGRHRALRARIGPLVQVFLPHTVVALEPRPRRGQSDPYRGWLATYRPASREVAIRTW